MISKYKRVTIPSTRYIHKPIPKHVKDSGHLFDEMLLYMAKEIKKNIDKLQEGQTICLYHKFQIYEDTQDEARLIRNSEAYKEWRRKVFERDNYTCRICGEKGVRLVAHHVEEFSENKELRLDLSNGLTVCRDVCHRKIHGWAVKNV